jgi:hypothetical protein
MNKEIIEKGLVVLDYAIENSVTITEATEKIGVYESFPRKLRKKIEKWYKDGEIDTSVYNEFNEKYNKIVSSSNKVIIKINDVNSDIDDNFDKRSKSWVDRNENGIIDLYRFKILIRDEEPFEGSITRKDMETIYQCYPYVTRNTVSQFFPYYTFTDFKRILRVFNITKDKLFPQHILEENDEEKIAEFALKAKESSSYKKFVEHKPIFIEKELRNTQLELYEERENKKWFDGEIDKFFKSYKLNIPSKSEIFKEYNNTDINNNLGYDGTTIFTIFGDIHFGKFFDNNNVMYGRGNNKDILRERCLEVIKSSVDKVNRLNSKKLVINCLGDIFESILPDGMHPQHTFEMDLFGHEQMLWGVEVFEDMFEYFIENTNNDVELVLYGIGGNHDRVGIKREDDKRRTATAIFYSFLDKIAKYKFTHRIKIIEAENGIIQYEEGNLSIIGFHGDSSLMKRKPIELMNLFKIGNSRNYTIIMNGHWHFGKFTEGVNYIQIGSGSVCSVDGFIQNEIGGGAQPSYIIGTQSKGYGFNFERIMLF